MIYRVNAVDNSGVFPPLIYKVYSPPFRPFPSAYAPDFQVSGSSQIFYWSYMALKAVKPDSHQCVRALREK